MGVCDLEAIDTPSIFEFIRKAIYVFYYETIK
jgi:hypothetical protein